MPAPGILLSRWNLVISNDTRSWRPHEKIIPAGLIWENTVCLIRYLAQSTFLWYTLYYRAPTKWFMLAGPGQEIAKRASTDPRAFSSNNSSHLTFLSIPKWMSYQQESYLSQLQFDRIVICLNLIKVKLFQEKTFLTILFTYLK